MNSVRFVMRDPDPAGAAGGGGAAAVAMVPAAAPSPPAKADAGGQSPNVGADGIPVYDKGTIFALRQGGEATLDEMEQAVRMARDLGITAESLPRLKAMRNAVEKNDPAAWGEVVKMIDPNSPWAGIAANKPSEQPKLTMEEMFAAQQKRLDELESAVKTRVMPLVNTYGDAQETSALMGMMETYKQHLPYSQKYGGTNGFRDAAVEIAKTVGDAARQWMAQNGKQPGQLTRDDADVIRASAIKRFEDTQRAIASRYGVTLEQAAANGNGQNKAVAAVDNQRPTGGITNKNGTLVDAAGRPVALDARGVYQLIPTADVGRLPTGGMSMPTPGEKGGSYDMSGLKDRIRSRIAPASGV